MTALCGPPTRCALTYAHQQNGVWNLWNQPVDGSPARQVTNFTSDQIFGWAWSADGTRFAVSRGSTRSDVITLSQTK